MKMSTLQITHSRPSRIILRSDKFMPQLMRVRTHVIFLQMAYILECRIKKALTDMKEKDRCIPWYYPQLTPDIRMCSPYKAEDFKSVIKHISANECKVLIPFSQLTATL